MNTSNHAFKDFDQSLHALEALLTDTLSKILQLNELCQRALDEMHDKPVVQTIMREARSLDKQVNKLEFEITREIQNIFSKYNPRGKDMRFVIGSIKLSTILESIADKSKNCIKRIYKTETTLAVETVTRITRMLFDTKEITQRIHQLLQAYDEGVATEISTHRKSIEQAYREIWVAGTSVDADYHNTVMLAKNIERIADMAVDLKKILYFIHTGEKHKKAKPLKASE